MKGIEASDARKAFIPREEWTAIRWRRFADGWDQPGDCKEK
jgi:hypothetical protein